MDRRAEDLQRKASSLLRSFKDRACRACEDGTVRGTRLMEQAKQTAQQTAQTISTHGWPPGTGHPTDQPYDLTRKLLSQRLPVQEVVMVSSKRSVPGEPEKVERLCALGFSVAAARHALRRCGGHVESAGAWLLDDHADEILAAELEVSEASPLREGAEAVIRGLQGAADLNGVPVVLQRWSDDDQRWQVRAPDGSVKNIRPRNLDAAGAFDAVADPADPAGYTGAAAAPRFAPPARTKQPAATGPDTTATAAPAAPAAAVASTAAAAAERETPGSYASLLEKLRALARELLGDAAEESEECLNALSAEELLALLGSLGGATSASTEDSDRRRRREAAELRRLLDNKRRSTMDDYRREQQAEREVSQQRGRAASASSSAPAPEVPTDVRASGAAAAASAEEEREAAGPSNDAQRAELADLDRRLQATEARAAELEAEQRCRAEALDAREAELLAGEARWRSEAEAAVAEIRLEVRDLGAERAERAASAERAERDEGGLEEQRRELERLRADYESAARELQRQQEAVRQAAEVRELRMLEEEAEHLHLALALRDEQAWLEQQRRGVLMLRRSLLGAGSAAATAGPGGCVEWSMDDGARTAEAAPLAEDEEEEGEVWDMDWNALGGTGGPAGLPPLGAEEELAAESAEQSAAPLSLSREPEPASAGSEPTSAAPPLMSAAGDDDDASRAGSQQARLEEPPAGDGKAEQPVPA